MSLCDGIINHCVVDMDRLNAMHCSIYKGRRKQDTYLYIPGRADFSGVPQDLLEIMGQLEHVLDLVLTPERRLARADACAVMRALLIHGRYVQLPAKDEKLLPESGQRALRD